MNSSGSRLTIRKKRIYCDDVSLECAVAGSGNKKLKSNGSATGKGSVIFLNGAGMSYERTWRKQFELSTNPGYRFIFHNSRGIGGSDITLPVAGITTSGNTSENYIKTSVSDTMTVIERFGEPPFHFVGHSMGGLVMVELYFACLENPEIKNKIKSLTFVSSPASSSLDTWPPIEHYPYYIHAVASSQELLLWLTLSAGLEKLFHNKLFGKLAFVRFKETYATLQALISLIHEGDRLGESINHIACPSLIIHERDDSKVSVNAAATIAQRLGANGTTVILPGSSHFPMLAEARNFNQTLMNFLAWNP